MSPGLKLFAAGTSSRYLASPSAKSGESRASDTKTVKLDRCARPASSTTVASTTCCPGSFGVSVQPTCFGDDCSVHVATTDSSRTISSWTDRPPSLTRLAVRSTNRSRRRLTGTPDRSASSRPATRTPKTKGFFSRTIRSEVSRTNTRLEPENARSTVRAAPLRPVRSLYSASTVTRSSSSN